MYYIRTKQGILVDDCTTYAQVQEIWNQPNPTGRQLTYSGWASNDPLMSKFFPEEPEEKPVSGYPDSQIFGYDDIPF